jgi:hypothetical protein
MTSELGRFGYTPRESDFLRIAALLGGTFVRRQFNDFLGKECGALAQAFVERSIDAGHVEALAFGHRVVYHVTARAIYSALGDPNNRNRRSHRPESVRRRLMALDYILSCPDRKWILTEQEKVSHFAALGISESDLPTDVFSGNTKRAFTDKQPIAVTQGEVTELTFVDQGMRTFSQWERFLKEHRKLVQRLSRTSIVFAGTEANRFQEAESLFRRTIAGETSSGTFDLARLKRFFQARRDFEEKRLSGFDQSRLDQFREDRKVFSGNTVDALYGAWTSQGDPALVESKSSSARFQTHLLFHRYEWLSPIRALERRSSSVPNSIASEEASRSSHRQTR